jgi:hypothetical protein
MTKPTIAEVGWLEFVIDHLKPALQAAENNLSDLQNLAVCDAPKCLRLFDRTDPRAGLYAVAKLFYCPACEIEAKAEDKQHALAGERP